MLWQQEPPPSPPSPAAATLLVDRVGPIGAPTGGGTTDRFLLPAAPAALTPIVFVPPVVKPISMSTGVSCAETAAVGVCSGQKEGAQPISSLDLRLPPETRTLEFEAADDDNEEAEEEVTRTEDGGGEKLDEEEEDDDADDDVLTTEPLF